MSDGAFSRWLTSRKNLAGMAGALAGASLAFVDVGMWPVAAVGLYGVGALLAPSDPGEPPQPPPEPPLTAALQADAAALRRSLHEAHGLPAGAAVAVRRMLDVLVTVLHRLDEVADRPADRAAAPERLAVAAEIIRVDLPACLDTYLGRGRSTPEADAAIRLATQLNVVAGATDRLAASVPDVHAERAEELTRDLLRRHGRPG